MKKILLIALSTFATFIVAGTLTTFWKDKIESTEVIWKLAPFKRHYDMRMALETRNVCKDVYGESCLWYLFDDLQACFAFLEEERIHVVCMFHGETESYLHIITPIKQPDGEFSA